MLKKNGLVYFEEIDIRKLFYQDTAANFLDKLSRQGLFNIKDLDNDMKWGFIKSEHNLQFLIPDVMFMAIPIEIVNDTFYSRSLADMIKNPLISNGSRADMIAEEAAKVNDCIDRKMYDYTVNPKSITKEPCYMWYWKDGQFEGVYNIIPQQLIDGPLSEKVSFQCDHCNYVIRTNDIPEMFYDPETGDRYCPNCANNSEKRLRHVGS